MQLLYVIFDSRFLTFTFFIKIIDSEEFIWNTLAQRFMYDKFSIVERVCWESLYGVIGSCFVRLMKNSIPQGQVIWVTSLQSLYMLRKQNKFLIHSNTI